MLQLFHGTKPHPFLGAGQEVRIRRKRPATRVAPPAVSRIRGRDYFFAFTTCSSVKAS